MLANGKSYALKNLFQEENRIIIPDMQREYCWGETLSPLNNKTLIQNFLEDLIESNEKDNKKVQLGLIYAYQSPKNEYQLCDGQQRITTLYLLLGYYYHISNNSNLKKELKEFLILDANQNQNSYDIRLQYAIRESTLFFLRDLINNFFLQEKNIHIDSLSKYIKRSDWYFEEYNLDPSIQNILIALDIFNSQKQKFNDSFAQFLLNKITMLYFDMGNRTDGEEQFVILNTTGEPLTQTENLKPLFLGDLDDSVKKNDGKTRLRYYADLWEKWELFFWNNRNEHKTADIGLKEFFRWVFIIESTSINDKLESGQEELNSAQIALSGGVFDLLSLGLNKIKLLNKINDYFESLRELYKDFDIKSRFLFKGELSQIAHFELLPLLSFIKEFNISVRSENFKRLKQFLKSRAKDENVRKASITAGIRTIQIVKAMSQSNVPDISDYSNYESVTSSTILGNNEKLKFDIYSNYDNRIEIEEEIWNAEDLKTSEGNVEYIFEALAITDYTEFDLELFSKVFKIVKLSFEKPTDLLRRALLTFGHYYVNDGNSTNLRAWRYCLGEKSSFFNEIFRKEKNEQQKNTLIQFIKDTTSIEEINEKQLNIFYNNCINNYENDKKDIWGITVSKIINDQYLIKKMSQKRFCVTWDEKKSFGLTQKRVTNNTTWFEIQALSNIN